jgi:predicted phage baseplate assembly protein
VDDLAAAAPDAAVYELDETAGTVTFGTGINGRRLATGAVLRVEYLVTSGAEGNLPRGILWEVAGVAGAFGTNREGTSGGTQSRDLAALRATARRRVRQGRPIVTTGDLERAALAFADLDVRRVQEVVAGARPRRPAGGRVLVAVGQDSAIWLREIRRRLAPRLPLGQSLDVMAPRFVDVTVSARLVAAPQVDPDHVRGVVEDTLRAKLAILPKGSAPVWPFGRDLTALTVKGWLRNVEGIARVVDVTLQTPADPDGTDRVELGPIALPRLQIRDGDISIERSSIGGAP